MGTLWLVVRARWVAARMTPSTQSLVLGEVTMEFDAEGIHQKRTRIFGSSCDAVVR